MGLVAIRFMNIRLRVEFPWDLLSWGESAIMTDLLKIDRGLPVFTSPEQANSFIYSPGLDYLCYGILRPFGLQLDVRYCRLISVSAGILAAAVAAVSITVMSRSEKPDCPWRSWLLLTFLVAVLLIFSNFTSGVLHPENLFIFHAVATMFITFMALNRRSFRLALTAIVFASLGVWAADSCRKHLRRVVSPAHRSSVGQTQHHFVVIRWGDQPYRIHRRFALASIQFALVASGRAPPRNRVGKDHFAAFCLRLWRTNQIDPTYIGPGLRLRLAPNATQDRKVISPRVGGHGLRNRGGAERVVQARGS